MSITEQRPELTIHNYCICFLDLLGQRDVLKGQGWLQQFQSDEERKIFIQRIRKTIGAILDLHRQAESMMEQAHDLEKSEFRKTIPPERLQVWDNMQETRVKTQRWSDGLVCFSNLGDEIKCQMNGLYWLIELAGTMCFLGLASSFPVRGGLDAAWAIELYPNELYGAAVARAYELESEVAAYPRIVVGERIVEFIHTHLANPDTDIYSENNRAMAETCKAMLAKDTDGYWIVDYLGKGFLESVTKGLNQKLYALARVFVEQQLKEHRASGNTKLVGRYTRLLEYFIAHQNVGLEGGAGNGAVEEGHNA